MKVKEAELIVRNYSSFYANIEKEKKPEDGIYVFPASYLPLDRTALKYAFCVYAEDLVRTGEIDKYQQALEVVYGSIDGTFKEEAENINRDLYRIERMKNSPKRKLEELKFEAKYGISWVSPDSEMAGRIEFHNFISWLTH